MTVNYPEWATEKQIEGMQVVALVANEYGNFDVEFKRTDYCPEDGEHRFYAVVTWGWEGSETGLRTHEFDIAWYYEQKWQSTGEECEPHWQFLFGGGDATREISAEVFFLDLFHYLDSIAVTKAA